VSYQQAAQVYLIVILLSSQTLGTKTKTGMKANYNFAFFLKEKRDYHLGKIMQNTHKNIIVSLFASLSISQTS
jgi:hypothetical protein